MLLCCLLNIWRARELSGDFCPVSQEANAGDLQPLCAFVRESALQPVDSGRPPGCPVLLVDDLSVLLSLGVGPVAVLDRPLLQGHRVPGMEGNQGLHPELLSDGLGLSLLGSPEVSPTQPALYYLHC